MSEQNQEKENVVLDDKGKEIKTKKMGFFKKAWYSITKFDKYVEMSLEGTGRTIKYLLQMTSLFVLIISCFAVVVGNQNINAFVKNVEENLPNFKYVDGQITLDENEENKVYTFQDKNMSFGKVIIDLNTEDENIIKEHENTIKSDSETRNMGFIILKNKIIQVAKLAEGVEGESRISMTYDETMTSLFGTTEVEITKSNLLEYLNGNGRTAILIVNFFSNFIAYFIIYICSGIIYTLILALIGFTSAKITKLQLTFSQLFAISTYAFTLSNLLNIIYFFANYFLGISIKYFDIAYIIIAYIYLIKTDMLRKQENEVKKEEKEEKKETDGQEQI